MQEKRDYLWIQILSFPPKISELLCRGREGFDYGFVRRVLIKKKKDVENDFECFRCMFDARLEFWIT